MDLIIDYPSYYARFVKKLKATGSQAIGLCPFHEDSNPSFSVNLSTGLFKCHACGKKGNVVSFQAALDHSTTKLAYAALAREFGSENPPASNAPLVTGQAKETLFPYFDQNGTVIYELVRLDGPRGKKYFYRHVPEGSTAYVNKKPERRVPYALPQLLSRQALGGTLYIVEGEKCAQRLLDAGSLATTTGSASSYSEWSPAYTKLVSGFDIVLLPDFDDPGINYVQQLAFLLAGKVKSLKILELWTVFDGMRKKDDIADLLERGVTQEQLTAAAQSAPVYALPKENTDLLSYEQNDLGNAARLLAVHGEKMRYCPQHGRWYCWDGFRWRGDTTGEPIRLAIDVINQFRKTALRGDYLQQRFSLASGNMGRLEGMLKAAAALHTIDEDKLDATENLLCAGARTVQLDTGYLTKSRPEDYITRQSLAVPTGSSSDCPLFLRFIHTILGGDPALIAYLQRALGYCLTGSTKEQVFFIAWGEGANGKSTLMDIVSHVMGEYAQTIPAEALTGLSRGGLSPELASVCGARLVTVNESGDSCHLNEGLIKQLTGNDLVYARPLYSQGFTFRPAFKIWLSTNHKPIIAGSDHGIWRRIHLIPFNVTISPAQMDRELPYKLRAESAGIFAWLCEGARLWYREGLQPPSEITGAVAEYRDEMDRIDEFLTECIVAQPLSSVPARLLYEAYKAYCESQTVRPKTQTLFGRRLTEMGFQKVKNPNVCYQGLELLS